jgi:hypothetical protein
LLGRFGTLSLPGLLRHHGTLEGYGFARLVWRRPYSAAWPCGRMPSFSTA